MDNIMRLSIDGMGIVFFSAERMRHIAPGTDFLSTEFTQPDKIAEHLKTGDISAFCTGSGGDFTLHFLSGYPSAEIGEAYPVSARLGLEVRGGSVQFCDLFWLSKWDPHFPESQIVKMPDGFYDVTVCTRLPESGYWGEDQTILMYFNKVDAMPALTWTGVPYLYTDD